MNAIPLSRPPSSPPPERCKNCGDLCSESLRTCEVCGYDLGCPNVRAAHRLVETEEVAVRYRTARESSRNRGVSAEFDALEDTIERESHVVVAIPANAARTFFQDPRTLYQGYENLVGSGVRTPASPEFDAERFAISGKLFGHYANKIRYGLLSLNNQSLKNYGPVHVQLRDVAVKDRVSFLFENSYLFFRKLGLQFDSILPAGYRCSWLNKKEFATTKLEPHLIPGMHKDDWANLLVKNGATRDDDSCIEAHIYDSFNANAVQSVEFSDNVTTKCDKLDLKIIKQLFSSQASGWQP